MGYPTGKCQSGWVTQARLQASISLPGRRQLLPYGIYCHFSDQGSEAWVRHNVHWPELRKDPAGWVLGFYAAFVLGLSDQMYRPLRPAGVRLGVGPILSNVVTRTNPQGHLPLPIKHDSVKIQCLGLQQPRWGEQHRSYAIVGTALQVETGRYTNSKEPEVLERQWVNLTAIH